MILRRITQHVKEQNWTAVVLDLFIVILGVFIGIQVSNWNEGRALQSAERVYLDRLAISIEGEARRITSIRKEWLNQIESLEYLEQFLLAERTSSDSEWDVLKELNFRSGWTQFSPDRTTFDELVSSGQLTLIRDADLRAEIRNYYGELRGFAPFFKFENPLRQLIREKFPISYQTYLWQRCFSAERLQSDLDGKIECEPLSDPQVVSKTVDRLRQDEQIIEAMRYSVSIRLVAITLADTTQDMAVELSKSIRESTQLKAE